MSFRYPDADGDTIHHISFTAHHGQTVALIGATGCGKSSIINLIPRLYDATSGQVLVDGVDVRDYTQDALRSKIGFVPQKAFLFAGTVSSNVGYGEDNASDAAIRKAVSIAQAAEFVESPEVGYSGTVAQGGSNFSGGQKQRLSIARAVRATRKSSSLTTPSPRWTTRPTMHCVRRSVSRPAARRTSSSPSASVRFATRTASSSLRTARLSARARTAS